MSSPVVTSRRRPALPLRRAALGLALALACRGSESGAPRVEPSAPAETRAALSVAEREDELPFQAATACRVSHGGQFLDLGSDVSLARRSFALGPFTDVASETWGEQSYTRFSSTTVSYDFWLDEPRDELEVRVRAKGGSAARLTASIDQVQLGGVRLRPDSFETLSFPRPKAPLAAGRHQLSLRWSGRSVSDARALGMIEWIHWAEPGTLAREYRPPRQRALRDDVVLGGVPRRAIVLETPSSLSCPVLLARDTTLELSVGFHGEGSGVARVIGRRQGEPPLVLAERRVGTKTGDGWTDLSIDLEPLGRQLARLELEATSETPGGRVAFSEPRLAVAGSSERLPRARLVVLVVASGLQRELLPPYEGTRRLRHINQLAAQSARFPEYRVPTTLTAGVMATLLSGLPPRAHSLTEPRARLPERVLTLADRIREASGESAFFTGVPHTRAPFGFARGYNQFEEISPVSDVPASAPLEHGRAWLERALRGPRDVPRLLVVHLRGGHPPWDLSRDEAAELEPREYLGMLEPRRGGIILAGVRAQPRPAQRRLAPADWVRLKALQLAALEKQDAALGSLIELLERDGIWNDTLFALTGDVAMGDGPEAPFGDGRPLTEDRLVVPLWIKFPGNRRGGSEVPGPVSSTDVAQTLAAALGVNAPGQPGGLDLYRLADGNGPALVHGRLARLGAEYSLRLGTWLLHGMSPKAPALCDVGVDPACVHDALTTSPLAAEASWRTTFDAHQRELSLEGAGAPTQPAAIDKDTAAALQVYGD